MSETDPATAQPADSRAASTAVSRSRKRLRRWVVAGVALALVVAGVVVRAQLVRGPVEVVEEFFAAIVDRDVDRALGYVGRIGYGVPYGEAAAFLHPEAIADGWELLEARRVDLAGRSGVWVQVRIGDEQTWTNGLLEVTDFAGEWNLIDPFVTVEFASAPLTYLHVNDRVLDRVELYAHDLTGTSTVEYQLLPGRYEFFPDLPRTTVELDEPKLLLPPEDQSEHESVRVPRLTFPEATRAGVQREVNALLDECVTFQVRQPAGCPFAAEPHFAISGQDDAVVSDLRDFRWSVLEYPVVGLSDPGGAERELGLPVGFREPGLVRLSLTGVYGRIEDGEYTESVVDVTVDCEVSPSLRVLFGPDAHARVYQPQVAGGGLLALFPVPTEPTCPDLEGSELP